MPISRLLPWYGVDDIDRLEGENGADDYWLSHCTGMIVASLGALCIRSG